MATEQDTRSLITTELPDRNAAGSTRIKAVALRKVLNWMVDFVLTKFAEIKAQLVTDKLSVVDFNDGLRFNYTVRLSPENNKPSLRCFRVATLLEDDNAALADVLRLLAVVGGWGSNQRAVIDLHVANRSGAYAYATVNGDPGSCGFSIYKQADKKAVLYLMLPNNFFVANISVVQAYQAVIHPTWVEEVPTGTQVYNSVDTLAYPPALVLGGTSGVKGFFRTGPTNRGFQLTGYRSGSSQTLNTNGYLELKLDDGNILKVAVLN